MAEEISTALFNSEIQTDDLTFSSLGDKYSFKFSSLGNGIFLLKSKGYADESSICKQIQCGDEARNRLAKVRPGTAFHLIWDISELKGASIFARYQMMVRAGKSGEYGSITAVGTNNLAKSFGKILSFMLPNLDFYFFNTQQDAYKQVLALVHGETGSQSNNFNVPQEVNAFSYFIDLWQQSPEYLNINNTSYKILRQDNWIYKAAGKTYKGEYSVIEGNIVLFKGEGLIKAIHIEKTYQMLEDIISQLAFNNKNRFYSIIDLKKIKGITLNARKLTNKYEEQYKDCAHLVIMIPAPILSFALKVQKLINPSSFRHWTICPSVESALALVQKHREGGLPLEKISEGTIPVVKKPEIPDTNEAKIQLIEKLYDELEQIQADQHKQINRILEITGRMTWDESFKIKPEFSVHKESPFADVYNALSIVHDDFQEIVREKSLHVQKLKESEDKYRKLINLANDIIVVHQDHKIRLVNSRVFQVLGYTPEEIHQVPPKEFLALNEYDKIAKEYASRSDQTPWYFETTFIHKNGSYVPVSVSVGRISYEDKPAFMLIIRDITSKRKAEAELDNYRNRLEELVIERTKQLEKEIIERQIAEESDRLKTAFLSNMSHEIRTPMNAIIAFSNFLKDNELSVSQREEYINYIQSSGQSLLTLINDIIDISKIEAKQITVQQINCSVNQILEELFILFQQHKKLKKNTSIELRLDRNELAMNIYLNTDPYRLRQILSNLLDNALKFTELGIVSFGFHIKNERIIFYVKDTGIGIPPDKTEYIFQRFGKIESLGQNLGGTGLGLAISHNLASLLGGALTLKSIPKEGSTFYLELPYHGDQQIPFLHTVNCMQDKQNYQWSGKKILVAEDEELNYKVIEIGLQKTQATIIHAKDGKEVMEMLLVHKNIDIILMDIQMPELNGYEALLLVKQAQPSIPVIAQTAFALMEERERCLNHGFNDYISKPISMPELLAKIDRYFS